jgi:hypothetical protein
MLRVSRAMAARAVPRLAARQMQATLPRAVCAANPSKSFAGAAQSESLLGDAPPAQQASC